MSGEKIQVCTGWWRQRCGNVVQIVRDTRNSYYPWRCASGGTYRNDGHYFSHWNAEVDLVEYIGKNITITAAD